MTYAEFTSRHGPGVDLGTKKVVFASGASVAYKGGTATYSEPPDDPAERAAVVRRFHLAAAEHALAERERLMNATSADLAMSGWNAGVYGPPPKGKEAAKKALAETAAWHRQQAEQQ